MKREISIKNDEIKNKIKDIVDKNNEIKSINDQISRKSTDSYLSTYHIQNEINLIKNDIKNIFTKVNDNLFFSLAKFKLFNGIIHQLSAEFGGNVVEKKLL